VAGSVADAMADAVADAVADPPGHAAGAVWLLVRPDQRELLPGPSRTGVVDPDWATFSNADLLRLRLDDVLQRAVDRACDALDGDAAYLLLAAGESGPGRLVSTGLPGRSAEAGLPGEPPADQPAAGALPAVYDDLAAADLVPVLSGTPMRSAVVAQLLTGGRSIGQLGVASTRPDRFGRDDAVLLQSAADRLALSVEARRLAESTRRQRDWLGYLAEASDLLAGTLEPQRTVAMFAQLLVPRLATWCAIRLFDERGAVGLDHAWHADETRLDDVRTLLATMPDPGTPARTPAPVGERYGPRPDAAPAVLRDHAVVTLPLRARGRSLGVALIGRAPTEPFDSDTLVLTEELVRRAALAVDNALLYRTHQATSQALQRTLLPAALPDVPGLDVGVAYQAAGEGLDVGGDFYDLFALGTDRWRCTVGDVAGNGPEAAGVTGLARHALHLLGRQQCPPAEAVGQLNQALLDQPESTRFLTLVHGEITPRPAGGMRVELVVAGHPLPYLLSPDGRAAQVGTPQPLLGVLDQVRYRTDTVLLAPGDTLLCLTDGVMERRGDGRVLGDDDLPALLAGCAGLSARAVATAVQRAVIEYSSQPPRDDMAVLVLRVLP
jgi:serine phosphatase RsbU (regulator of sigma subunit)